MKRSEKRILTSHVGSLVRPEELREFLVAINEKKAYDEAGWEAALKKAIGGVVRHQVDVGIDVISDGEFGKSNWNGYLMDRVSGFEPRPWTFPKWGYIGRDKETFEAYYREARPELFREGRQFVCVGPITYNRTQLDRDIANFKAALNGVSVEETFMPVITPGSITGTDENHYYKTEEEFVYAIADAVKTEYKAIIEAGFLLQVDDALLTNMHDVLALEGEDHYRRWANLRVEALNYALEGIPEEKIRYHVCWGSWFGPHTTDVPLKDIVDIVLKVKAQAYSVEAAGPKHEHEWKVWKDVKLPQGKLLLPGIVTHRTPIVEDPELVSDRIIRFAEVVGRENVIAATDCGFAQGHRTQRVHESIMWAKLGSLVEGARMASKILWS